MQEGRLLRRVVCSCSQPYKEGSIFMDTPIHMSMEQSGTPHHPSWLGIRIRKSWNRMVNRLKKDGIVKYVLVDEE